MDRVRLGCPQVSVPRGDAEEGPGDETHAEPECRSRAPGRSQVGGAVSLRGGEIREKEGEFREITKDNSPSELAVCYT